MADRGERELVASENGVEPSCPECGHYNAMLVNHDAPWDGKDHRKCRDCGAVAVRVER